MTLFSFHDPDRLWSINSILELKQKLDLAKKKTPRVWFDVRSKFVKSLKTIVFA